MGEYPFFAKPANLGSSVGISKCNSRSDLGEGLMEAARFDRRLIVEQGVHNAREIEVSVLGNEDPQASVCGEVLPSREFYSYESKYIDGTSGLIIPSQLPPEVSDKIREYAIRAYKAIDCAGMARADFFIDGKTNRIYLNELNTIPGFTSISMYPKLWQASGLTYPQLVDRLIELALERKAQRDRTEHRRTTVSDKKEITRSEIARQRRAQRAAKELTQTSKRALKPAVTVSSRVAPPDASVHPQTRCQTAPFQHCAGHAGYSFAQALRFRAFMPVGGLGLFSSLSCWARRFTFCFRCLIFAFPAPRFSATTA